jgi:hypothetical protein
VGVFTALLTLPLAPVRGVVWVADQLAEEADRELYDEDRIRAELMQLEFEAEEDRLSEPEIHAREDALLERLAISQSRRAGSAPGWRVTDLEGNDPYA